MPSYLLRSPIGMIRLTADRSALTRVQIVGMDDSRDGDDEAEADALLSQAAAQFRAYFAGGRRTFELPLVAPSTPAGPRLRAAIASVGYGETASYGELARRSGSSPRAIGQACRRNPYPILVPCHRVLGAAGALGNYSAGSGTATKRWLLDHEGS